MKTTRGFFLPSKNPFSRKSVYSESKQQRIIRLSIEWAISICVYLGNWASISWVIAESLHFFQKFFGIPIGKTTFFCFDFAQNWLVRFWWDFHETVANTLYFSKLRVFKRYFLSCDCENFWKSKITPFAYRKFYDHSVLHRGSCPAEIWELAG